MDRIDAHAAVSWSYISSVAVGSFMSYKANLYSTCTFGPLYLRQEDRQSDRRGLKQ